MKTGLNFRIVPYEPRGSWLVIPQPFIPGVAFMIECDTEDVALKVAEDMVLGSRPTPLDAPTLYEEQVDVQADGVQKVFRLAKE